MQYDVLDMPGRGTRIRYNYPTDPPSKPVLQPEQDDNGETIYRQVNPPVYPQPDSHYVIRRNSEEEVAWQVYAGPFNVTVATEIAAAMQHLADSEVKNKKYNYPAFAQTIREEQLNGLTNREIAEKYGLKEATIRDLSKPEE